MAFEILDFLKTFYWVALLGGIRYFEFCILFLLGCIIGFHVAREARHENFHLTKELFTSVRICSPSSTLFHPRPPSSTVVHPRSPSFTQHSDAAGVLCSQVGGWGMFITWL